MWSVWLVFCDWGFYFVWPLMNKNNRLMEAFWWERLTVGAKGSCSDCWWVGPSSVIFNPIFCWWKWLCSLPFVWPEGKEPTGDSWTLTGKSVSFCCGDSSSFSWPLGRTRFHLCPPKVRFPVLWKFCNQIPLASKVKLPRGSQSLCQIPRLGNLL